MNSLKEQATIGRSRGQLMGIAEYEFRHPGWREMIEERQARRGHEKRAQEVAKDADEDAPIDPSIVAAELSRMTSRIGK